MSTKPYIYDVSLEQMPKVVSELGLKPYAANQIISWLYKKRVFDFDMMTNLSKEARSLLKEKFRCEPLRIDRILEAGDGTKKIRFVLNDDLKVEAVDMPDDERRTVCISTQAGCAMGCKICRTGEMGLQRNLTQGEIIGQLLAVQSDGMSAVPVTNVVLMGMGEPMSNLDAVSGAVEIMLDERAVGLSHRRITVSTCGLLPELESFVGRFPVKIAISLSATTNEQRNEIMPINKKYPIEKIMEFCRGYSKKSKYRITFEYVLIGDFNDSKEDAKRLVNLLNGISAKINLIPFNSYSGCKYKQVSQERLNFWRDFLFDKGVQTNVRVSRGHEIMAACGQLGER